jgi:voltage-gated potassium channel
MLYGPSITDQSPKVIVTVTTVGYGDRFPVTPFGQGVAVFLMLVGIGLIGVLTATFASYFVGQDLDKAKDEREAIRRELEAAQADRDRLASKLDLISAQMDELLRRTSPNGLDSAEYQPQASQEPD